MASLSTPIAELRARYDVIVVGSGYGGAIAAYRMAESAWPQLSAPPEEPHAPSYSVCVLERGLERQAGDYPESSPAALREIQIDSKRGRIGSRTGLFDLRINDDVSVLVGCGLGGTSQINAGVMLKPRDHIFASGWPKVLSAPGALDDEYRTVAHGLGVNNFPPTISLNKVTWLKTAADRIQAPRAKPAPIAVAFETEVNGFNVQRQRCVLCGNCVSGCNHSAKNTLPANFLAGAANLGAAIFCGMQVQAIRKEGDDWLLHVCVDDGALAGFGSPEMIIRARAVFLAAGTLGTTEILLRSRDRFGLPLSAHLGHHFSGNGDAIAFGYNGPEHVDGIGYASRVPPAPSVGPTIAAMIEDRRTGDKKTENIDERFLSGAMIQEGAIPGALGLVLRFFAPLMARVSEFPLGRVGGTKQQIWREIDSMIRGPRFGALYRTQTFLAMSEDDGSGQMGLKDNRLRIKWTDAGHQAVYKLISARLAQLTRAMNGRYVVNPFWSRLFGYRLMTVHPLGGCRLADSAAEGVANADGEVFDARSNDTPLGGLYVCDGSIIPRALGTNPALTISALAERIANNAAARGFAAPTSPIPQPRRVDRTMKGIRYAERLRGHVWKADRDTRFELVLRISAEDLDRLISDPAHEKRVIGIAHAPDEKVAGERRWTVTDGTLNVLLDDPRHVDTRLLVYQLTLTSESGQVRWLHGHKTVNYDTLRRHPWLAITRVPFVIFKKKPALQKGDREPYAGCRTVELWDSTRNADAVLRDADVEGVGVVASGVADAMRLVLSLRTTHEPRVLHRLRLKRRFVWWFLDALVQLRVWPIRRTRPIDPLEAPKGLEPAKARISLVIKDKGLPPRFHVSRYRGTARPKAARRPVLLAPGFGMSSYAFQAAGDQSFAEHLFAEGYDVWLLDYRASDVLDASLEQWDLDVLARDDFPEAIKTVYTATGRQPVQVIAHCVASLVMQMALLTNRFAPGPDQAPFLHSVMLSQSYAFIDHPLINRLKAKLRLPHVLSYLNFRPVLTADYDLRSSWPTRMLDRLLHFYPSRERCGDGVCRRLLLMYGEVVRHDQLDKATHESLYHLFDRGNLTSFKHLARMIGRGRIVDAAGNDVYLQPKNGADVRVPITLLQGTANQLFRPSGMRKTHAWLVEHGGFPGDLNAKMFTPLEIPRHGHLDNFIGKHARAEVFDKIVFALEAMDQQLRGWAEGDPAA
jgi:cholesterol oxidase